MFADFIIEKFNDYSDKDAFILKEKHFSYADLAEKYDFAKNFVKEQMIKEGEVVGLEADYSPLSTAFLLALINKACIIVPISHQTEEKRKEFIEVAKIQRVIKLNEDDTIFVETHNDKTINSFYQKLRDCGHPGLILFSSGSTGVSKAAVHDFAAILEKYKQPRKTKRMITFLLFDHIGGINTLFHNLANGGTVITIRERTPAAVLKAVEQYKVQVLPVSPTFINMILLSEAYKSYDLSSLDTVSYGTEVMPETTLKRFHELFPDLRMLQTYGLSEIGIMQSKSKSSDSLWVKLGGEGFETRIVDNMLEVKAKSAMLGYLNAPSPFTEDGWFKTMDMVEADGEYIKILGRKSEIINVGGEKVYPAEVESVLMRLDGVEDVAVKGESHPIMGNIVTAKFKLKENEDLISFKSRMRKFCKDKIQNFKIPQKVSIISDGELYSDRFKKLRK